jgi:crossover junction endodeoxyribonuclease RuvC
MGIDPGIAIVGFGIIEKTGNRLKAVQYGAIQTEAGLPTGERLKQIYDACRQLIGRFQPSAVAIEKLYFNRNVTTAFTVGQARGVILLASVQAGLDVYEYTPLQIKQAVVGYGQAEKRQIQEMVKMLLNLPEKPKPDDTADALGAAITHAHMARFAEIREGTKF